MMSRMMVAAASCMAVSASIDHVSMVQAKTQVADSPYPKSLVNYRCAEVPPLDIDLAKYTESSWFVQYQQEVAYQTKAELRCVVATYDIGPNISEMVKTGATLNRKTLKVYNYRLSAYATKTKENAVDSRSAFCAVNYDEGKAGALKVGPECPDADQSRAYYHVVKVGPNYDWAIVTGGPLTVYDKNTGLCTTADGYDASGLWLFSRDQVMDGLTLAEAKEWCMLNGISWTKMIAVRQGEGWCGNYIGAYIKKNGKLVKEMR